MRGKLNVWRMFTENMCKMINFHIYFIACFISILDYPSRCCSDKKESLSQFGNNEGKN